MESASKYLIYSLIAMLVLTTLHAEVSGKIVFCKNCRKLQSNPEPTPSPEDIAQGNIINAPSKCKPGMSPDKRKICRKIVYNN
jgi:hypothetical protein